MFFHHFIISSFTRFRNFIISSSSFIISSFHHLQGSEISSFHHLIIYKVPKFHHFIIFVHNFIISSFLQTLRGSTFTLKGKVEGTLPTANLGTGVVATVWRPSLKWQNQPKIAKNSEFLKVTPFAFWSKKWQNQPKTTKNSEFLKATPFAFWQFLADFGTFLSHSGRVLFKELERSFPSRSWGGGQSTLGDNHISKQFLILFSPYRYMFLHVPVRLRTNLQHIFCCKFYSNWGCKCQYLQGETSINEFSATGNW